MPLPTISRVTHLVRDGLRGICDATWPQTCVACGTWMPSGRGLACDACHAVLLADLHRPYCPRCGRTLPPAAIHADGCARCGSERFWNVAAVARAGLHTPPLRDLVLALKYRGQERNAEYLADLLELALEAAGWGGQIEALVPVPMHWLRRWQRPCDHARLLTAALARRLRVPVVHLVRRVRHGPSQTTLSSKAQRFENVKGCFDVGGWRRPDLAGRTLCIVDNLIAAGATVHEVSKVLRRAGARRIYAAAVARPPAPGDPPVADTW